LTASNKLRKKFIKIVKKWYNNRYNNITKGLYLLWEEKK